MTKINVYLSFTTFALNWIEFSGLIEPFHICRFYIYILHIPDGL